MCPCCRSYHTPPPLAPPPQLLPLGYHMASLRWLETMSSSPDTSPSSAWLSELRPVLGAAPAGAAPCRADPHFYDAGRHISRLLAGVAAFQLRQAACPGEAECLPTGAKEAGKLIRCGSWRGGEVVMVRGKFWGKKEICK